MKIRGIRPSGRVTIMVVKNRWHMTPNQRKCELRYNAQGRLPNKYKS